MSKRVLEDALNGWNWHEIYKLDDVESIHHLLALRTGVEPSDDHNHYRTFITFGRKPRKLHAGALQHGIVGSNYDDELAGCSQEDRRFLSIVQQGVHVNEKGNLEMPLPFKKDDSHLPNNQIPFFRRTKRTLDKFSEQSQRLEPCLMAMGTAIRANHVEPVPKNDLKVMDGKEWCFPVFPVFNPKKSKPRLSLTVWRSIVT
ncbi:uncharacterized protein LOC131893131 [Tigriopus californicus]|uniref:uncharacterized protein LOC131893131 n=1 Tax=Tigriopus californicus TaxID=6832 RepID=UPI0027DA2A0E|nr:uncharacterized protein LOC131893131 [Tigriopus californicus]